jgi:hypothetical protein
MEGTGSVVEGGAAVCGCLGSKGGCLSREGLGDLAGWGPWGVLEG